MASSPFIYGRGRTSYLPQMNGKGNENLHSEEFRHMLTDRRQLLAGAGAFGLVAAMPAIAQDSADDRAAKMLLDTISDELLSDFPETAAGLGIDKGPRIALRSRFGDRSHEADTRRAQRCAALTLWRPRSLLC